MTASGLGGLPDALPHLRDDALAVAAFRVTKVEGLDALHVDQMSLTGQTKQSLQPQFAAILLTGPGVAAKDKERVAGEVGRLWAHFPGCVKQLHLHALADAADLAAVAAKLGAHGGHGRWLC